MNNETGRGSAKDGHQDRTAHKDAGAKPRETAILARDNSAGEHAADFEKRFIAGEISFSRYIAAKKNVVLAGTYQLDAPVVVDGEEIVLSGTDQPLIIDVLSPKAFSVNKGRLSLNNVVLRVPSADATDKPGTGLMDKLSLNNILVNMQDMSPLVKQSSALIRADNESTVQLQDTVITGASHGGIRVAHSTLHATNMQINRCKGIGLLLQASSAVLKECAITKNGTIGAHAQIRLEKSTATIKNCTISNSKGGEGITLREESSAEIIGCTFNRNVSNAVSAYHLSNARLRDCTITENGTSEKSYAQIYLVKSAATVTKCTISDARGGSGVALDGSNAVLASNTICANKQEGLYIINASSVEIKDCTIRQNSSWDKGKSQVFLEKSAATIEKCVIGSSNSNGIILQKDSTIGISGSTFRGNAGNALSAYGASNATLTNCVITENGIDKKTFAQIYLENSVGTIEKCIIKNSKGGPGIALFKKSKIVIVASTISDNFDNGLSSYKSSTVEIRDSTIAKNGTKGDVYAQVYLEECTATLDKCIITDSQWGYGVYIHGKECWFRKDYVCNVTVSNTRLEKNRYGITVNKPSSLTVSDCVIHNNFGGNAFFQKGAKIIGCEVDAFSDVQKLPDR